MSESEKDNGARARMIDGLSLHVLHASATNPRKHFNKLEELRDSILAEGVISPLIVRESKDSAGMYEIGAGERRFRALKLALSFLDAERAAAADDAARDAIGVRMSALEVVPVIVRDLDDARFMALQLVENLQRDNLTALEESDALLAALALLDPITGAPCYTISALAVELGRSVASLRRSMKLARLVPLARAAVAAGVLPAAHAAALARIPSLEMMRLATLKTVFGLDWEDAAAGERAALKLLNDDPAGAECMTFRAAEMWIAENCMATLRGVEWSLDDADLLPVANDAEGARMMGGACASCPHLTGNNEDLDLRVKLSGGGVDAVSCMMPSCKRAKNDAWAARSVAKLGAVLLPVAEAFEIFEPFGENPVRRGSDYVDLEEKPGFELVRHVNAEKVKPWKGLLKGAEVPFTYATDHAGKLRVLVDREAAIAAVNLEAVLSGKESPFAQAVSASHRPPVIDRAAAASMGVGELAAAVAAQEAVSKQAAKEEKARVAAAAELAGLKRLEGIKVISEAVAARGGLGVDDMLFLLVPLALEKMTFADLKTYCLEALGLDPADSKAGKGGLDHAACLKMARAHLESASYPLPVLHGYLVAALLFDGLVFETLLDARIKAAAAHFGASMTEAGMRAKDRCKLGKKKLKKADKEKLETRSSTPRNVVDFKCDFEGCGAPLEVPFTQTKKAASLLAGEMLCVEHGGEWRKDAPPVVVVDAPPVEVVEAPPVEVVPVVVSAELPDSGKSRLAKFAPLPPADAVADAGAAVETDEARAFKIYCVNGSPKEAAVTLGFPLERVKKWTTRHKWAARRAVLEGGAK